MFKKVLIANRGEIAVRVIQIIPQGLLLINQALKPLQKNYQKDIYIILQAETLTIQEVHGSRDRSKVNNVLLEHL